MTDIHTCLVRERQPSPNQTFLTTDQVRITDEVYAGDTLYGGAVNNSTLAPPRPICLSLNPDLVRASGTYTSRVAVSHRHARNGRPVAAVKFILTDGVLTKEAIVSTMSTWVSVESGKWVPHFAHTFDLTGFTANAVLTEDWVVYPWRGALFDTRISGAPAPSISFGTRRVFNDVSYGTAYVYVDPVSGNNGTGVASTNPATAAASPFLSHVNACTALRTYNNANFSRDHVSGGVIRVVSGTTLTWASLGTTQTGTMGDLPLVIENAGGYATRATTIILQAASGGTVCPARVVFRNLTIRKNNASNVYVLENAAGAGSQSFANFEACAFDVNGYGSMGQAFLNRVGRCWMIDCTANGPGITDTFSTDNKVTTVIGGTLPPGSSVYNMVGNRFIGDAGLGDGSIGTGNRETPLGMFVGFTHLGRGSASNPIVFYGNRQIGPAGLAIVGTVLELYANGQPVIQVSADGMLTTAENINIHCCTFVGQRFNCCYQDTGTALVAKDASVKFNVFDDFNCKTDTHPTASGNRVGNWSVIYKCGWLNNVLRTGDNTGDVYGVGAWQGEIPGLGEVAGTNASPINAAYVNPQAPGTGGGDYTPGIGNVLAFIPADMAPHSVDQVGRVISNSGTARVGALQMT